MRRSRESAKLHHIISSSGDEPQTHPSLAGSTIAARKVPVAQDAEYICADAVNVPTLLRSTRAMLLERAQRIGASCLVGEEWTCTICGPKHRSDGTFRVHIRYSADATRSDRPDPRKPVAVAEAKSVPGLMTIIERR
ncbi:hypothetical protein PLICRDRAFT_54702 [Plicaturopsis crispa FD-325 SS-3]|nr:hypothetical protein PLICRDRAFT_54702 [Plicaturopsis crispa FD-325 SS-3]